MHGFCACKTMCVKIVDSSLYGLIYNELTDILFLYILPDEDMLNTKGLATLTEHQEVSWRLIKVENWDGKTFKTCKTKSDFTFNETCSFKSNWLDS